MLKSEKKTLIRFLSIYTILILTLIITISIIYFKINYEKITLEYKSLMQEFSIIQTKRLKWLHNHYPKYQKYPRDDRFNSAIYDLEYTEIFSTLKSKNIQFDKGLYFTKDYVIYRTILSDYYLGAKYLFIEIPKNKMLINNLYKKILFFDILSLIILLLLGYYLSKLFVKPMKESIELLDNFIKDTTHEINTPISIINSNIEMFNSSYLKDKELKILKRIKVASKTLELIYKDLKFSVLEHKKIENSNFNLKDLIVERCEYFAMHLEAKKIKLKLDLEDFYINADYSLISRMVDNILSNAIKYNKHKGSIEITLKNKTLKIKDSGVGIKKEHLSEIFARFSRFNSSEGGFGIGLNIVKQIIDIYNLKIEINSKENIETEVVIKW